MRITEVSREARQAIVQRPEELGETTTVVVARGVKGDPVKLAFALRWLMDYYLYQASKEGGMTNEAIEETLNAAAAAADSFFEEVAQVWDPDQFGSRVFQELSPVSELGKGVLKNPYDFVRSA